VANSELLQAFLRLGIFIVVGSLGLLLIVKPNQPEFVVTILSLCIGATLVALVAWTARRQ